MTLQIGSLVIMLPSIHTGGALTVEHGGVSHTFDWSMDTLPSEPLLQWGTFHSGCEYKADAVTNGARIALTYKLISVPPSTVPLQVLIPSKIHLTICDAHKKFFLCIF